MTGLADHLPVLQVVVPLLVAPLVALLHPRGLAWAAATVASVASFLLAVRMAAGVLAGQVFRYALGGWPAPYGIALEVDAFSALLLLILTGASTMALAAGRASLDRQIEPHRQPLFFSAWLLALAGMAGILVSADAFNIFVFMEISSLASYVLVAGGPDRRALPAVFRYLIMGTVGATFYLIGVGLIYMMTGTLNLADMELRIHEVAEQRPILVAATASATSDTRRQCAVVGFDNVLFKPFSAADLARVLRGAKVRSLTLGDLRDETADEISDDRGTPDDNNDDRNDDR